MKVRAKAGRVSDVLGSLRADWSQLRHIIRTLEPGKTQALECPPAINMAKFRSMILIYGRRYHKGAWRLSTHSTGRTIQCFLTPTSLYPGELDGA